MPQVRLDPTAAQTAAEQLKAAGPAEAVPQLGGRWLGEGQAQFGFWVPQLADRPDAPVRLRLLLPPAGLDPGMEVADVDFDMAELPMAVAGPYAVAVVEGVWAGTRERVGVLYEARVGLPDGEERVVDALAWSMPFGAFAPAELVDTVELHAGREDAERLRQAATEPSDGGVSRQGPPASILQVHVATATTEGTLAALARRLDAIADKLRRDEDLAPGDRLWLGYDAVELLPVEPTIHHEAGPAAWEELASDGDRITVRVRRPRVTDWGYDVPLAGGAAVNPSILERGRPHELIDLTRALHRFPEPIRLILDVVYGHADNQGLRILHPAWFTGPDMYGQHLDYRNPIVRAHLLEMQRRRASCGADGLRVDGAQDFTYWDGERLHYDDELMEEMSAVVVEVAGVRYRPWMVFEDGRPWPRDDWELASSYRAVIDRQPHVFQWGPLTFAHNTPFLFTFWISKWWRLREIAEQGSHWISGCANHDTLRRGSQVDPTERINSYLGTTLPDVIERAYDHPAATLLFGAFFPGVPMEFLQATARAPWSFIRNTDHRYAIKVWAEEARFLDWRVRPPDWEDPEVFPRIKRLGFGTLEELRTFMATLEGAVRVHGDAIDPVVGIAATAPYPPELEVSFEGLVAAARAWMDDVAELCTVDRHLHRLDPDQVAFDLAVRRFRQARRWLRDDLGPDDTFTYRHPTRGSVVFGGHRIAPDGSERVLFVANMEGSRVTVRPADWAPPGEWTPALVSPGLSTVDADGEVVLGDGTGVVYTA